MKFEEILKDLKSKIYKPVYFLMGEEPYYIDKISDYVEKNILNDAEKEFNQTVLYGQDVTLVQIAAEAKRFPMMGDKVVVIIKEAQNIKELSKIKAEDEGEEKKEERKEKTKSALEAYVENPLTSTILVFCYKYKTLDKRTSLAKTIAKKAVLFDSKPIYENELPGFITKIAEQHKLKMGVRASFLMAEYSGNDLLKIENSIEKLSINVKEGIEVTEDDIQKYIGISKEYNVFELQKALAEKNILKANRIANYFGANEKENPLIMTIASLFNYYNKVLTYHVLKDKSRSAVASALKINPFFVSDYEKAAKTYPPGKVVRIISDLRQYDLKSKGFDNGSATQGELLRELVFKILH